MVKKSAFNFSGKFEISYYLCHPDIPPPQIGFRPDWEAIHASIPGMLADHADCPGIQSREKVGITLFMPYTCRFYRDGHIEIETYWEEKGQAVFSFQPKQDLVTISPKGEKFPGFIVQLPESPDLLYPLHMFVLGDVRVNAWIVQSGVLISALPPDYTLMILPLPNYPYPPGYSVGQALVLTVTNIAGQLKIPLDLNFSALPPEKEAIEIPKGTPLAQYLPVRLPEIALLKK